MATFRDAVPSDASSLASLFSTLLDRSFDAQHLETFISDSLSRPDDGVRLFVIDVGGQPIASCQVIVYPNALRHPKKKAVIDSFVVAPEARRKGYGKILLSHAIEFIDQCGVEIVSLVSGHHRVEAHSLYESLGFSNFGRGYTLNLTLRSTGPRA